jgi:ligand-binding SRPBCC domain-containing protein
MKIKIATIVQSDFKSVFEGFNRELFLKLAPPFPKINLLRFDGCKKGDETHLELNFLAFKQRWDALIIENGSDPEQFYFIDQATKVPFFISKWQHRHVIQKSGENATIIDDIDFSSPFGFLLYPVMYLQFLYRKPIYRRVFTRIQGKS